MNRHEIILKAKEMKNNNISNSEIMSSLKLSYAELRLILDK